MIKYVVQIICEQETCGSGGGLKCNTCKEMGTASHLDPFLSLLLPFFSSLVFTKNKMFLLASFIIFFLYPR